MFSFLNGFILPALFATAIPLILHFLSRKKARKMPFSSIKFLKIIENQKIKRIKLYQILLILVRTLFIAFIILAFARPSIHTGSSRIGGNQQTTAVIILDDSYSMQAFASSQTYFDLAKEFLKKISFFKTEDKVFLVSGALKNKISLSRDEGRDLINNLAPSNRTFNMAKSLLIADSLFKSNINLNNELYLLSDGKIPFQENMDTIAFAGIDHFKAYKINFVQKASFHNAGIDSVVFKNELIEVQKPLNLSVFISNYDPDNPIETNLNVYSGDERVAMDYLSLNPAEKKEIEISYTPTTAGIHYLKIEIDEDDLSLDNTWYLSFNLRDDINILYVTDDLSEEIKVALAILSDKTLCNIKVKKTSEWPGEDLNAVDIIVFDDLKSLNANIIEKLNSFVLSGNSIIIIPGASISREQYNLLFASLAENDPVFSDENSSGQNSFFSLEEDKQANPIFESIFRDLKSSYSPPVFFRYFTQNKFTHPLIRFSNGDPLLSQSGPLFIFSSSFKKDWTDLTFNGLFIPLLYRTFYLAAYNDKILTRTQNIGDKISFSLKNHSIEKSYKIINPGNESISVIAEPYNGGLFFNGGVANEPGFYHLSSNGQILESKSVNHSSRELKRPYAQDESFGFSLNPLNEVNIEKQVLSARTGFELWMIFLFLSVAMVLCEMILIKKIEGTPFLKTS